MSISLLNLSGFFTLLLGITLTARYYFVPFNIAFTTLPYVPDPITLTLDLKNYLLEINIIKLFDLSLARLNEPLFF